ncbi:MAG: Kelch repeat-containing protein [Polyangiales bacterium]
MIRRAAGVLALLAASGCSSKQAEKAAHHESAAKRVVLATPRIGTELGGRLGVGMRTMHATVPTRALGETRLSLGDADVRVSMVPLVDTSSFEKAHGETDSQGVTVFENAAIDGDRVLHAGADVFEELWVLRSRAAPRAFRIVVDGGLAIRLHGPRIEVVDQAGTVHLATTDVVAEDARGERRTLTLERVSEHEVIARLDTEGLAYPVVVDPAWFPTTPMNSTSTASPGIRLASGKILVVAPGQVYDPVAATWTNTGPINTSTSIGYHSDPPNPAALLADDSVVRMGSFEASADRYRAATNAWALVTPAPRFGYFGVGAFPAQPGHAAGAIAACDGADTASDVMYVTGGFAAGPAMTAIRRSCGVVTLANGSVLVVGGGAASAEVYNPTTNTWKATGPMSVARDWPLVMLLPTGKVLAAGGVGGIASAELYDPATNAWTATGNMNIGRSATFPVLSALGKVLVMGGVGAGITNQVEQYDPATGVWTLFPPMLSQRKWPAIAVLPSGQVLAAGGWKADGSSTTAIDLATAEIYGVSNGGACTSVLECVSGNCVDGVCCSTASCGVGAFCNTPGKVGTCSKPLGTPCAAPSECASGQCIDKVCCATTCPGQCQACDVPGHNGTCFPVAGAPHGTRAACAAGAAPECGARCDGTATDKCAFPGAAVSCGKASCSAHVATTVSTCAGDGTCTDASHACGAYACGTDACKTMCTSAADCFSGFACVKSECVPAVGLGVACTNDDDCSTGFCTDGVCCSVRSCKFGESCALGDPKGTCAVKLGVACKMDAECTKGSDGTGHCVDGVCCDTSCTGQCEACDVTGSFGTCSAAVHAPHGSRTKCDDGGAEVCKAAECNGVDTTKCSAFVNGTGKECAKSHCDGDTFTSAATCDGMGTCAAAAPTKCAPYRCDDVGCFSSCVKNEQCTGGNGCIDGKCQAIIARCSASGESSIGTDGKETPCAPYRCSSTGTCGQSCASSTDCAGGYACDPPSLTCVATDGGAASEGGCTYGGASRTSLFSWLAIAAGLAVWRRKAMQGSHSERASLRSRHS